MSNPPSMTGAVSPDAAAPEAPRKPSGNGSSLLSFVFVGLSLLLLAGSVFRAATYPFTHDECLSFAIFTFEPRFGQTANHHLLNTWAMEASARVFGPSELALRLPNLMAHLVYLGAALFLARRLANPALQICAFVALNLNPFVLDFFFLARGYGMALAALLVSLALLVRASEEKEIVSRRRWLLLALGAGAVSVLANFSFLFFYVTLHGVIGILYFPRDSRRWDLKAGIALLLSGVFLAFVASRLKALAQHEELYLGGSQGFFQDTAGSLIQSTLYRTQYPSWLVIAGVIIAAGLLTAALGAGAWVALRERRITRGVAFTVLLLGTALLPILSHAFGQSLLPVGRAALAFLPLAATAFLFSLSDLWRARPGKWAVLGAPACALLVAIAGVAHFSASYNLSSCSDWAYDANDKAALGMMLHDQRLRGAKAPARVAVSWFFLPTFTFYHATLPSHRIPSVKQLDSRSGDEDYAYVLKSDEAPLLAEHYSVLARFADTDSVLLRHP